MGEENNKDYEFVTETIKKKPVNKKRFVLKVLHSVLLGILAGFVACIIFAYFSPIIYNKVNPDEPNIITIPQDDPEAEQQPSEPEPDEKVTAVDVNQSEKEDDTDKDVSEGESQDNEDADKEDSSDNDGVEENVETEVDDTETDVELVETDADVDQEEEDENTSDNSDKNESKDGVTLEDYKKFYHDMNETATVAKRSLVEVKSVTNSTDWFNNSYEAGNVTTGLIVADNGKELLIITESNNLKEPGEVEVTFCDSRSYKGKVKKSDSSTDMAVVAVELDSIEDITKNAYAAATLGNSMVSTLVGSPVIAVGSPLGIENSMAIGLVTSNSRYLERTDDNIRYITTDIYGSTEGSGVLVNLEGQVLGIIFHGGTTSDTRNLIHAYSISDIKSKIERLSNGQETAYLGIVGTDVTTEAMEELSVPQGAYVKQVVVDSPAMKGGLQNGDVIVKLGTSTIYSFKDFKTSISKYQPGDTIMVTVKRLGRDGYVEFSYEIYLEALK